MKKLVLSIITSTAIATSAFAGKNYIPAPSKPIPVPVSVPLGLYLGGGLTYSKAECECETLTGTKGLIKPKTKSTTYGFNLKAGYNFNEYMAIEAKYIYTPWKDKDRTVKHYGLYLKPTYPITENFDVYALLGYGITKCETLKDTQKGFGWGAGAEYTFNKKNQGKKEGVGVFVEYLRPLKKTGNKDIKIDMVNAGVSYNF